MAQDAGQKLMKGLLEAFVLESLGQEPKHGYALLKEMEEAFGEQPNRNKIYPLLNRFQEDGLIREVADEDPGEGRGRTLYALTEDGERALEEYRRLPDAFRATVQRLWTPRGGSPPRDAPAATPAEAPAAPSPESRAVPVAARETPPPDAPAPDPEATDAPPYPCPDARVRTEKDPRTGDLDVRLTGCPMGAFDYCPLCPVYKSVQGLRVVTFGGV